VLADLDVIAAAPPGMNASGYADLLAKRAAGADWILADAAGEEPIDPAVWSAVQDLLRSWLTDPAGVPRNDPACLRGLIQGLLMVGFAMQAHRSSRPASGAEHQFSHLWDMQNHRHGSAAPSHGFKVGIGTLASLALYEDLLRNGEPEFDIAGAGKKWPSREEFDRRVEETFGPGDIAEKAKEETRAKYLPREDLEKQLYRLRGDWPRLRGRLKEHLFGFTEVRDMLREAGCPAEPEEIGISRERLRRSYRQAYFIRRRYTVLDFAERWALSGTCGDRVFGRRGPWPPAA
jgi:glycerol-1-phosphate dehydrogenase [NAD(P)+]